MACCLKSLWCVLPWLMIRCRDYPKYQPWAFAKDFDFQVVMLKCVCSSLQALHRALLTNAHSSSCCDFGFCRVVSFTCSFVLIFLSFLSSQAISDCSWSVSVFACMSKVHPYSCPPYSSEVFEIPDSFLSVWVLYCLQDCAANRTQQQSMKMVSYYHRSALNGHFYGNLDQT